jgi:rhamnosyltransferase subunit B
VLALFSRVLCVEQKDWPPNTLITGFAYYDAESGNAKLPPQLEEFVASGEPPVVFTLGSAAVLAAGDFYEVSAEAAMEIGTRAVLLIGSDPRNKPKQVLPSSICIAEYAPYSKLFSSASVIVHQGGVGTTAQCLKAGKPMLIMPYSHDQPDNARRMKRLGVAKIVQKAKYNPQKVTRKVRRILDDPELAQRSRAVAEQLRKEDGVKTACDALEQLCERTQRS